MGAAGGGQRLYSFIHLGLASVSQERDVLLLLYFGFLFEGLCAGTIRLKLFILGRVTGGLELSVHGCIRIFRIGGSK